MGASQSSQKSTDATSVEDEKAAQVDRRNHRGAVAKEPLTADGSISLKNVEAWEHDAASDLKVQLARTILVDTDFKSVLAAREARVADAHIFNLQLNFKTEPITNQKSSGRCWLFATTNVLRHAIMQNLALKEFQLSQVGGSSDMVAEYLTEWYS